MIGFTAHEVHLRDYLYILRKRKIVILITFLLVVVIGVFLTYRERVIYRATATMMIERDNPNIVDFKEVMAFDTSSTDYYQTQYQMLSSDSLVREVIESENLTEDAYLTGMTKGGKVKRLARKFKFKSIWLAQFLNERSLEGMFTKAMLKVDPVQNSRLVHIRVFHPDPAKAASIANTLVTRFIQRNLENRFNVSSQATKLLSEQLEELKAKVVKAEGNLQDYKEENNLINIPSIREKDAFIEDAKLELVKQHGEEAKLAKRYLPAHPKMIHIRSQIEALEESIRKEEAKSMGLSRIALDYEQLEREAVSAREIYETLMSRFQEMHSEANTQSSNIVLVDPAKPPVSPYKPRPFLNMLIAVFMGLVSGLGLAFFYEYLDSTVKIPDDIEKGLGLDLFGIIPYSTKDRKGPAGGEIFFDEGKTNQAAESFRALRTALMFKLRHVRGCRVLLTSSPNPSEGKSTVTLNLAMAFAQNNLKVLLVDSDLRKPKLHGRLGVDRGRGFSDLLEGEVLPEEVVQKNVGGLGFDFLSCGSPSHHPTELLGSHRMVTFVEYSRKHYDIVLIDSPPFLAVADVSVLSEFADGIVLVACYQKTDRRHLRDVKRRFGENSKMILGVVINQVSVREKDYYYHQYYYYGYGDAGPKK